VSTPRKANPTPRKLVRPPTLAERAAARDKELAEARAHAEANPDDAEAVERYRVARAAHYRQMTSDEYSARARRAVDLVAEHSLKESARRFAEEYRLSEWCARDWIYKAIEDSRPDVATYRHVVVARLEGLADAATKAGDFRTAGECMKNAGRLAGVERTTVDVVVQRAPDATPPHLEVAWKIPDLMILSEVSNVFPSEHDVAEYQREGRLPAVLADRLRKDLPAYLEQLRAKVDGALARATGALPPSATPQLSRGAPE
jgi:hypothetical protein